MGALGQEPAPARTALSALVPRQLERRPPPSYRRVARPASAARARELTPGVWSLQLPLCYQAVVSVNAYLLRAGEGWILWDCGSCLPPGWAAMEHALDAAGVRAPEVTMLVASHAHTDHRGLAAEVLARTGARFAASPEPHPMIEVIRDPAIALDIRRDRARREGVPEFALDPMVSELPGMDTGYPDAVPELVLEPGSVVDTDCGPWEVIALPGHGADQIGLFNARLRWLLSADLAFASLPSYLEYGTRPDPHADHVGSLDRAIALAPELLLPGHGRPAADAVAVLRHCRAQVLTRVEHVQDAIAAAAMTAWDVAVALTPPHAGTDHYQRSLSEALCVLEHLELHGRARPLPDAERRRIWRAAEV